MILGPMEGVSRHGFRDESSNTYRIILLIVRDSSILVIDMKKVFERSLNYTTRKNTANLLLAFSLDFRQNTS